MPLHRDEAEQNLNDFISKYGEDGFLKLFITDYLVELILFYIHSKPRKEKYDTSYLFYVNYKGETYSSEQVDTFKSELKKECGKRAENIVKELRDIKKTGDIYQLEKDPTKNPEMIRLLRNAFDSLIKEVR